MQLTYTIYPLGDTAATVHFGNVIDINVNKKVMALFDILQKQENKFITDIIPAYSSLTIVYDFFAVKNVAHSKTVYEYIKVLLESVINSIILIADNKTRQIKIPVCYDSLFGTDLNFISKEKNISAEEIIEIHCAKSYRVFMIGFLPGFAYMGEVDERISIPRKKQPANTIAGSIGIAGKQTGIYPLDSPGGWQIIGRTSVNMFDITNDKPVYLQPGDEVSFYSITKNEFEDIKSGHT